MRPPRLVLLHGFTGGPESFAEVLAELDLACPPVVPVLLGHAGRPEDQAPAGHPDSFEREVDRMLSLLDQASRGRYHLVGYSLGARLALGLLARHGSWFRSATLIGVSAGLPSDEERQARRIADERLCQTLEQQGVESFVDLWQREPLFASQARLPQAVQERQRAQRLRHDASGLALSLRALGLGRMPSYANALPEIRQPVDVVVGGLDAKFVALAHDLARLLPNATVTELAQTGHNVVLERPAALAELIQSRLRA